MGFYAHMSKIISQKATFQANVHMKYETGSFFKNLMWLDNFPYFNLHREGVQWDAIDWMDNAECLDLIEKVTSLLSFL